MGKYNVEYQTDSQPVAIYLDRYTAERLLLALTQALEPAMSLKYYKYKKEPSKKGKGTTAYGMKLTKGYKDTTPYGMKLTKGKKGTTKYGLNLTKGAGAYAGPKDAAKYAVPQTAYKAPPSPKVSYVPPKGGGTPTPKGSHKGKSRG